MSGSFNAQPPAPPLRSQERVLRIGLIRHFEVKKPMPSGWLTSQELRTWREEYERADVTISPLDLGGIAWRRCFSSDLPRAYVTAKAAFHGDIIQRPELREPDILSSPTGRLRLPLVGWRVLLQLAWLTSHSSQRPAKDEFLARVRTLRTEILASATENTLIVSHGGMMMFLRKELLALGFTGPKFSLAQNGKLYVFEKRLAH
jgi:hypothetical protein